MRDAINAYSIAVAPDSSLKNFRMALIVTGANSRARTCTQEYAAAAKLNRKNHLRAHRKDPDWEAAVPAREFAPVTSFPGDCRAARRADFARDRGGNRTPGPAPAQSAYSPHCERPPGQALRESDTPCGCLIPCSTAEARLPPPLWGRIEEGGRAEPKDLAPFPCQMRGQCDPPPPCPAPTRGAGFAGRRSPFLGVRGFRRCGDPGRECNFFIALRCDISVADEGPAEGHAPFDRRME